MSGCYQSSDCKKAQHFVNDDLVNWWSYVNDTCIGFVLVHWFNEGQTTPRQMELITALLFGLKVNSMAPGRCSCNLKLVISQLISRIDILNIFSEIALIVRWVPKNPIDNKSTLVQVMAWCHQASSHCLSQRWPKSLLQYGPNELKIEK